MAITREAIRQLLEITEFSSVSEAAREAMELYMWAASQIASGRQIASIDIEQNTYTIVLPPGLKNVREIHLGQLDDR